MPPPPPRSLTPWQEAGLPLTRFLGGVLVLDPMQSLEQAGLTCLALEYRLWLVDPQGGASLGEGRKRQGGAWN